MRAATRLLRRRPAPKHVRQAASIKTFDDQFDYLREILNSRVYDAAVETPLQLECASAAASAKAPSGQGAFKLPNASMRGQKRRNGMALPSVVEFLEWSVEKMS